MSANPAKSEPVTKADPNSANSVLAAAYDDHEWQPVILDTNTTDGIKRTLKAHGAAIQALANHIDGVKADPKHS